MNCISIVSIGRDEYLKYCLPTVEKYCQEHNCDLQLIKEPAYGFQTRNGYNYKTFEKNQVYNISDKYTQVLRLDSDVIITPNCPDIFEEYKDVDFGCVFEDVGSRKGHRQNQLKMISNTLGKIDNNTRYFNSGVVLYNTKHKELFKLPDNPKDIYNINLGSFKEQSYLNWQVANAKINVTPLSFKFNHLSMFSEPWSGADKKESYIIHYAGGQATKAQKMKNDFKYFYERK